jgi:hypothetical protein
MTTSIMPDVWPPYTTGLLAAWGIGAGGGGGGMARCASSLSIGAGGGAMGGGEVFLPLSYDGRRPLLASPTLPFRRRCWRPWLFMADPLRSISGTVGSTGGADAERGGGGVYTVAGNSVSAARLGGSTGLAFFGEYFEGEGAYDSGDAACAKVAGIGGTGTLL